MQNALRTTTTFCALFLLLLALGCSQETSTPLAVPIDENNVALKDSQEGLDPLPQVITDAVMAEMPGATIVAAFKEKESGKTVYEVIVEREDGAKFEVEVDKDGKVLAVEDDDGDDD